jgi:hypothetical protein
MENHMNWKIEWMKKMPQAAGITDVVVEVGWRLTGTEGQHSASAYGSVGFTVPESPGKKFTPFDKLTEQQVLSWVWSSGVDREATEAAVAAQLDALVNPPTIMAQLPWSTQ